MIGSFDRKRWAGIAVVVLFFLGITPWLMEAPGLKAIHQKNPMTLAIDPEAFNTLALEQESILSEKPTIPAIPLVASEEGDIPIEPILNSQSDHLASSGVKPKLQQVEKKKVAEKPKKMTQAQVAKPKKRTPEKTNLPKGTYLRLGVFSTKRNAQKLQKLLREDFPDQKSHQVSLDRNGKTLQAVYVGPIAKDDITLLKTAINFQYEIKSVVVEQ